eukprot:scaffold20268_cov111-Isochrysis_galbana.AAC.4
MVRVAWGGDRRVPCACPMWNAGGEEGTTVPAINQLLPVTHKAINAAPSLHVPPPLLVHIYPHGPMRQLGRARYQMPPRSPVLPPARPNPFGAPAAPIPATVPTSDMSLA